MTVDRMFAAGCQYWEWQLAPIDADGNPIDPTGLPVAFAAVDAAAVPAGTWAGIVAQAAGSAAGSWQGPDTAGYDTARVLVSGVGGGGDIELATGDWRMLCQITSTPERPVEDTGILWLR
ncbi:MAG: hypothetical protein IT429_13165 [Gemmataceae bacterium]|nr:hypothetical protein [Gemmataceae bacterium]